MSTWPFTKPTVTEIYNRMKSDYEGLALNETWMRRSMVLALIKVFAGAVWLNYGFLVRLSKQLFFTEAGDFFREWWGRILGIPELAATKSIGSYTFTGVDTTPIPQYTEVQTESGVVFKTDTATAISGTSVTVAITAALAGTDGNIEATTMSLVTPIVDIDTDGTLVDGETSGGTEDETREAHVARLLERMQTPPGSGNIGDYKRWAREADVGVGRVWCLGAEDWYGAGTVGVILGTANLEKVSAAVKAAVVAYIETKRPVGADVDVEDIEPSEVDLYISISPNTTTYQDLIDDALDERFLLVSGPGADYPVTLKEIRNAIYSTGVTNFEITDIEVDGVSIGVADIETEWLDTARFNTATYATLT